MIRSRFEQYVERARTELHASFVEDHTPRQVAGSFALGTFITMLPTLGTGLVMFLILSYLFESINRLALFASVVVYNPPVKWGVYASSITIGVLLLGPVEGVAMTGVSIDAGPALGVRLLVGNLILAVVATVASYVIVYRLILRYRGSELVDLLDDAVEELVDEPIEA